MATMEPETKALEVIESAWLSPTEHLLLKEFVNGAVDSKHAGQFILQEIDDNQHLKSLEQTLRDLKESIRDLVTKLTGDVPIPSKARTLVERRDGPGCCLKNNSEEVMVTPPEAAYIIPPDIFDDHDMRAENRLYSVAEAFLTASKLSQLKSLLNNNSDQSMLKNLWMLSPTIHSAFREGHLKVHPFTIKFFWNDEDEIEEPGASESQYCLVRLSPEKCAGLFFSDGSVFDGDLHIFKLRTSDPATYCLPSRFLLRTHCRFAELMHLLFIEYRIAQGWPQPALALGKTSQQIIRRIWRLLPKWIRVYVYRALANRAKRSKTISPLVWRLPGSLYLKYGRRFRHSTENEANALKTVERHTKVPAPLLVDTFQNEKGSTLVVMTGLRGNSLEKVFHRMSYQERHQLSDDIKEYVAQLRKIPNPTSFPFADTLGGPVIDHRLPDGMGGPFATESEFNSHLVHKFVSQETRDAIATAHSRQHRPFFTHADLHPSNILIEGGRLSGIIDWECAGFLPEYWEFTKAMFGVWNYEAMENIWRRAFGSGYEEELRAEQLLWKATPVGI